MSRTEASARPAARTLWFRYAPAFGFQAKDELQVFAEPTSCHGGALHSRGRFGSRRRPHRTRSKAMACWASQLDHGAPVGAVVEETPTPIRATAVTFPFPSRVSTPAALGHDATCGSGRFTPIKEERRRKATRARVSKETVVTTGRGMAFQPRAEKPSKAFSFTVCGQSDSVARGRPNQLLNNRGAEWVERRSGD